VTVRCFRIVGCYITVVHYICSRYCITLYPDVGGCIVAGLVTYLLLYVVDAVTLFGGLHLLLPRHCDCLLPLTLLRWLDVVVLVIIVVCH